MARSRSLSGASRDDSPSDSASDSSTSRRRAARKSTSNKRARSRSPSRDRKRQRSASRDRDRPRDRDKDADRERGRDSGRRVDRSQDRDKEADRSRDRDRDESQIAAQMSANLGYSNSENPFGDSNLSQKFVWLKKREQEAKEGITMSERLKRDLSKREENDTELTKLKKRRDEREVEQQLREEEQARLQREQDRLQMGDWEAKESEFHLEQAKTRAKIRIKDGRAKPIDILAMNLSLASDSAIAEEFDALGLEIDTDEPYLIFADLSLPEVEELHKDILLYLSLEKEAATNNRTFWEAMVIVCNDELSRHRERVDPSSAPSSGVSLAVRDDIERMFSNKSYDQLAILQREIEAKLSAGGPIDVEYWEAAIKALIVWKAKAKLRDMHSFMLLKRLERLREKRAEEEALGIGASEVVRMPLRLRKETVEAPRDMDAVEEGEEEVDDEEPDAYEECMSPLLTTEIAKADADLEVVDEEDDFNELVTRKRLVKTQVGVLGGVTAKEKAAQATQVAAMSETERAEAAFIREAAKNMDMDETTFNEEEQEGTTYLWQDKYRPRKPRYFNRVHTGYEWNKYNQTHYDSDNPPPKVVQGYKFNIFYPDLIDKSKAPTYRKIKDPSDPDTVILRFEAGPPYEDIAFRIVSREWEYSHKKGFRSSYDRGVLQLWFHFKRHYYRR
ncbi:mid region of cactin-domain-containing protein [Blyttiomyces helicus]|uniref:Splicing factor Cactin n=1 Tax=Blyttiomyces helicus TaxID=388810 RepID=A0A4V1ISU3_9FUNG|nr:mid region of cactin-domain-containing protein [Blyttiomyces helicus]|eukprot:RKO94757.1 mid region of cactin-domain-containing protein [Blyttiomyces helicus]